MQNPKILLFFSRVETCHLSFQWKYGNYGHFWYLCINMPSDFQNVNITIFKYKDIKAAIKKILTIPKMVDR